MTCVVVVDGARTMSVNEALARRVGGGADRADASTRQASDPPLPSGRAGPAAGASGSPGGVEGEPALTTAQLIDRIVTLNPTATSEFLAQFSPRSLGRYLAHLTAAQEPRGPGARWTRPGDSPAIVMAHR